MSHGWDSPAICQPPDMYRARGGGMTMTGDLSIPSLVGFASLVWLSGLGSVALFLDCWAGTAATAAF